MKKASVLFVAMAAVALTACSNSEETKENEEVVATTYSLDMEKSTIEWKGSMSPEYFHAGTVKATEGSITMEGDELKSGSFTIDMNSIEDTSLEDGKSQALEGHLKGTMVDEAHPQDLFFNTPKFPEVTVTLNSFKDGQLNLTMNILGKKLDQTVPATLKADEKGASINGDFAIDFSSMGIPGFQPNPEDGSGINPKVEFKVALKLTK